jgi:hypothetical protein
MPLPSEQPTSQDPFPDMRISVWICSKTGDGRMASITRHHPCLLHAIILLSFVVDVIVTLDLGLHRWPVWTTTAAGAEKPLEMSSATSASHTAISTLAFFIASTVIYRINQHDRWQDHFILAGITSGVASSFLCGGGLHSAILQFMPWTVILSLLCSIVCHRIAGSTCCKSLVLEEKAPLLP